MSSAQGVINEKLAKLVDMIINPIIELAFAVAVLIFIYGIWEYFFKEGEEGGRDKGRKHIFWGVVGLTIMIGAYGIINIVLNTIGADKSEFNTTFEKREPLKLELFKK